MHLIQSPDIITWFFKSLKDPTNPDNGVLNAKWQAANEQAKRLRNLQECKQNGTNFTAGALFCKKDTTVTFGGVTYNTRAKLTETIKNKLYKGDGDSMGREMTEHDMTKVLFSMTNSGAKSLADDFLLLSILGMWICSKYVSTSSICFIWFHSMQ